MSNPREEYEIWCVWNKRKKEMSDLRKEFEVLPEIKDKLCTVEYSPMLNQYHAKMINSATSVKFIQGAWYAFQEQQKKIDEKQMALETLNNLVQALCSDLKGRIDDDLHKKAFKLLTSIES